MQKQCRSQRVCIDMTERGCREQRKVVILKKRELDRSLKHNSQNT